MTPEIAETALRAAVLARADALASNDPARLTAVLHPAFRWTSHRGETVDRAAYVRNNTAGRLRWLAQVPESLDVALEGTTGVVTCVVRDEVEVDGEPRTFRMPVTQTWVDVGGEWLCLAGHAGPALD